MIGIINHYKSREWETNCRQYLNVFAIHLSLVPPNILETLATEVFYPNKFVLLRLEQVLGTRIEQTGLRKITSVSTGLSGFTILSVPKKK